MGNLVNEDVCVGNPIALQADQVFLRNDQYGDRPARPQSASLQNGVPVSSGRKQYNPVYSGMSVITSLSAMMATRVCVLASTSMRSGRLASTSWMRFLAWYSARSCTAAEETMGIPLASRYFW